MYEFVDRAGPPIYADPYGRWANQPQPAATAGYSPPSPQGRPHERP